MSKKVACTKSRACKWQGEHDDLLQRKNEEQSEELGITIYDRVCPDCGNSEYYELKD